MPERSDLVVPTWGLTMETATVTKWLKAVGDPVHEGEPVVEISMDKADGEVESTATGVIAEIVVEVGEEVEPGQLLARIDPS